MLRPYDPGNSVEHPSPPNLLRLQLIIGYDGRPYGGWQSQAEKNGVQDFLEKAFASVCNQKIVVHGSGRTDAGVHAIGQSAHVEVPRDLLPVERWRSAINANLPREIRVKQVRRVSSTFHARFDATSKQYRYRIFCENWLDPLEVGRAWQVYGKLDLDAMRAAASMLTGEHDFRAFAANRGRPESSTVRHVWKIHFQKKGPLLTFTFEGNGFLYKMVRLLVGMIVRVGLGKDSLERLDRMLHDPTATKSSFAAPAGGLYLVKVGYGTQRKD